MSKEIFGIDSSVLRELKNLFKETGIEEMEMEEPEKFYIRVSRKKPEVQVVQSASAPASVSAAPVSVSAPSPVPATEQYDDESKYYKVTSPVIGTYYEAPSPGAPAFAKVGDMVSPDTTVCIIEAMKVMNEIKAEIKGKIVQSLKSNEDSVLSGETIFVIEKS